MARNFSLRTYKSTGTHPAAYKTSKFSLNQQWAHDRDSKMYGWWNHDTHELSDSGNAVFSSHYRQYFESGDALNIESGMKFGLPVLRTWLNADNTARDWQTASDVFEYRHTPATRAYEDAIIKRNAEYKASKAVTPAPKSERDIMLERVTTTGDSGLGKARRKVSR